MNILSLFDGISCGQLALKRAEIEIDRYYSSETDIYCIQITQNNFPQTIQLGDATTINFKRLPKIDLLLGGPPCQDLSIVKRNAKGLKGKKSSLFFEFTRALKEVNPRYFLLENVKMKNNWKNIITTTLDVEPIEINSADFSAQNRRRLYWTNIPQSKWVVKKITSKDVLDVLPFRKIPKYFWETWGNVRRIDKGLNWVGNDKLNCLTTKNSHTTQYLLNKDKTKIRLLTTQEYEKLQTLPLGYTDGISDTQRFKCIGNGWTIDVIKHIFTHLKKELK